MSTLIENLANIGRNSVGNIHGGQLDVDPTEVAQGEEFRENQNDYLQSLRDYKTEEATQNDAAALGVAQQSRISGDIGSLVPQRTTTEAVLDVGTGVAQGALNAAAGVLKHGKSSSQVKEISDAIANFGSYSKQSQVLTEDHAYKVAMEAEVWQKRVNEGLITPLQAEVEIAKSVVSNMNVLMFENLQTNMAGSLAIIALGSAIGGPTGAYAGIALQGVSSWNESVDGIADTIYEKNAFGNYTIEHDILMESAPSYKEAFERSGDEAYAREILFHHTRDIALVSTENIAGTLLDVLGDVVLARVAGLIPARAVKGAKKPGLLKKMGNTVKGGAGAVISEGVVAEGGGGVLRVIGKNKALQEGVGLENEYDLKGTGEEFTHAVASSGARPGAATATGLVNDILGSGSEALSARKDKKDTAKANEDLTAASDQFSVDDTIEVPDADAFNPPPEPPADGGDGGATADEHDEVISKGIDSMNALNTFNKTPEVTDETPDIIKELLQHPEAKDLTSALAIAFNFIDKAGDTVSDAQKLDIINFIREHTDSIADMNSNIQDAIVHLGTEGNEKILEKANNLQEMVDVINSHPSMQRGQQAAQDIANNTTVTQESIQTPEGQRLAKNKLNNAPEKLTKEELKPLLDSPDFFSENELTKVQMLMDVLDAQARFDDDVKARNDKQPIDSVGLEVTSNDQSKGKNLSIAAHAAGILDSNSKGKTTETKTKVEQLSNFLRSQKNKLAAVVESVKTGEAVEYDFWSPSRNRFVKGKYKAQGQARNLIQRLENEISYMGEVSNLVNDVISERSGSKDGKPKSPESRIQEAAENPTGRDTPQTDADGTAETTSSTEAGKRPEDRPFTEKEKENRRIYVAKLTPEQLATRIAKLEGKENRTQQDDELLAMMHDARKIEEEYSEIFDQAFAGTDQTEGSDRAAESASDTQSQKDAPKKSSPSFSAPIENAVESVKKVAPLVKELDSVEQSIEETTDKDALNELEEKAENLHETISENVDGIIDQLIDQLDDMPSLVADGIRDELNALKDSEEGSDAKLRDLSTILRTARNISNSTGDLFGNDTPSVTTTQSQQQDGQETSSDTPTVSPTQNQTTVKESPQPTVSANKELSDFQTETTALVNDLKMFEESQEVYGDNIPSFMSDIRNRVESEAAGKLNDLISRVGKYLKDLGKDNPATKLFNSTRAKHLQQAQVGMDVQDALNTFVDLMEEVQELMGTAPATAAEVTTPTTTASSGSKPQSMKARVTEAINQGGDNVKSINFRGKDRTYVMIDGVVYNADGKEIVAESITKHFKEAEGFKDPDAVVSDQDEGTVTDDATQGDVQQDGNTLAEHQAKSDSIFSLTSIGKAVKNTVRATRIYTEGFFRNMLMEFNGSNKQGRRILADFMKHVGIQINNLVGTYNNGVPSKGSFLEKIHNRINAVNIGNLTNDGNKHLNAVKEIMEPLLKKKGVDFDSWFSNVFGGQKVDRTKLKGRAYGDAVRAGIPESDRLMLAELEGLVENPQQTLQDIKNKVVSRNPEYRMMDLMSYDHDTGQFKLDDTIKAAVAAAMVDFAANFDMHTRSYTEEDDLAAAFGVDRPSILFKGNPTFYDASWRSLQDNGFTRPQFARSIMADIAMKFLDLKGQNNKGEGLIYAPFENLIGSILEADNSTMGIWPFTEVQLVQEIMENGKVKGPKLLIGSIYQQDSDAAKMMDYVREEKNAIQEALTTEPEQARYIENVPKTPTRNKRGNGLTRKQQKAAEVQQSTPFKLNGAMFNLWTNLGLDNILDMFGYPVAEDPDSLMNEQDRISKSGKNTQLRNALGELKSLASEIADKGLELTEAAIYYAANFSTNTRLMMEGGYNPQGDKLVRSVSSPHREEINASTFLDFVTSGSMENATKAEKFLTIAYAQAFGVSLQNRSMEQIKEDLNKMLTEDVMDVAEGWARVSQGTETVSPELIQQTLDLLGSVGADWSELALQTLVEIGTIKQGKGLDKFTTHAYIEADGITNGPFMAGFLLGASISDPNWIRFMSNGGLYIGRETNANTERSAQLADPTQPKPDNYTAVTEEARGNIKAAMHTVRASANSNVKRRYAELVDNLLKYAFDHIGVDSNGDILITRNTAKNPVTVTFYGSGTKGIGSKFAKEVEGFLYEVVTGLMQNSIEDVAAQMIKGDMSVQDKTAILENMLRDLNLFEVFRVSYEQEIYAKKDANVSKNILGMNTQELQKFRMNSDMSEGIVSAVQRVLADSMGEALSDTASSTLAATNIVGNTTNAYSILAATLFQKKIDAIVNSPDFDPVVGLSQQQINQIKKEMEQFGINGVITESLFSIVKDDAQLGEGVAVNVKNISGAQQGSESRYRAMSNLGVSGIPGFVISKGDGATILNFLTEAMEAGVTKFLQVYDGINLGFKDFEEGGKLANDSVRGAVNDNPIVGLLSLLEKGMYPMLKELGIADKFNFQITEPAHLDRLRNEAIKHFGEELAPAFVSMAVRAGLGLNISTNVIANDKGWGEYISELEMSENAHMSVTPIIYNSVGDFRRAILKEKHGEILWEIAQRSYPFLGGVDLRSSASDNYSGVELVMPNDSSVFSLRPISFLASNVTRDLDVLSDYQTSVDQMAAAGNASVSEGKTLDTSDPNEIARILAGARRDKAIKADGNNPETVSTKDLKDNRLDGNVRKNAILNALAKAFPSKDPRRLIAMKLGAILKKSDIGIELTDTGSSRYDPNTKTILLRERSNNEVSAVTFLHEAIHAVINSTLDTYYHGDRSSLDKDVVNAVKNLEMLLDEVTSNENRMLSQSWALGIAHMGRAGNHQRDVGGDARYGQIHEMLAIFLTDGALMERASATSVTSPIVRLYEGVKNFFKSLFGIDGNYFDKTLYGLLNENMQVLAIHGSQHGKETSGTIALEAPPELGDSARRAVENIGVNVVNMVTTKEQAARVADAPNSAARDNDRTLTNFQQAGFDLGDEEGNSLLRISALLQSGMLVNPDTKKALYKLARHMLSNLKPEHFGDTSVPASPSYYMAMNKFTAVTGAASRDRVRMVSDLIALSMVNEEMVGVLDKIGLPKGEKSTERDSNFEKYLGNLGYKAINDLSNFLDKTPASKVPSEVVESLKENLLKKP